METFDRDRFIKVVRSWKGTKWKHSLRIKNKGCDCVGLLVGALEEYYGTKLDIPPYLNRRPRGGELRDKIASYFDESADRKPGDILLIGYQKTPHHVAIYTGNGSIIHSYNRGKAIVIEEPLSHLFSHREVCSFDITTLTNHIDVL